VLGYSWLDLLLGLGAGLVQLAWHYVFQTV